MLEQIFAGNLGMPMVQPYLTEEAVARLKKKQTAADAGLAAELLHHSPEVTLEALLHLFRKVLLTETVPGTWKRTIFNMLPKTRGAKSTSDFRPIAVVRLLYKTFACLVLGRIEATLDAGQPAEQHGFRADRRRNLWEALGEHGVSDHMLRVLQCMYHGQTGRSGDNTIDRDWLCIGGSVRQGCVLRPLLFSCVLEVALGCWRRIGGNAGVDFQDGIDILLFAKTFQETKFLLGELVTCLAKLGYTSTWRKQKYLQ